MSKRVVLFLQGPPSRFWTELADRVEAGGAEIRRINLCLGDFLYWRRRGATNYRGGFLGWRRWLGRYLARDGVTDIVYFADRLPYHRVAARLAAACGVRVHSVEFGYLRPDWLTIEAVAGGAHSRFPDDMAAVRELAAGRPEPDMAPRYGHSFFQEALNEVVYNLALYFGRPLYPFYWSDKYYPPPLEYLRWIPKLILGGAAERRARRVLADHLAAGTPYHLFALQMQSDYQLRKSSGVADLGEVLDRLLASFARHASPRAHLLIKLHPLDSGWENWPRRIRLSASRLGVAARIAVIDGGDLGAMIRGAEGVVTVNSTVGIHALRAGRPVKALGAAIYDIPGVTHRGPLDTFWTEPEMPDAASVQDLVTALAAEIQVKGSFYNRTGRAVAAREMARRILADEVGPQAPWSGRTPPRLARLRDQIRSRML